MKMYQQNETLIWGWAFIIFLIFLLLLLCKLFTYYPMIQLAMAQLVLIFSFFFHLIVGILKNN